MSDNNLKSLEIPIYNSKLKTIVFGSTHHQGDYGECDTRSYWIEFDGKRKALLYDSVVTDVELANFVGVKCDTSFRRLLWQENPDIFWKTEMHEELREIAMNIPLSELDQVRDIHERAMNLILEYEAFASKLYKKPVKFNRYR
jgi:hypothetical protein